MKNILSLLIGIYFGLVLVKTEVASWFRIQKMFGFEEAHMYLVIGSAVIVGALSVLLIKKLNLKTVTSEAIEIKEKKFRKGPLLEVLSLAQVGRLPERARGPFLPK